MMPRTQRSPTRDQAMDYGYTEATPESSSGSQPSTAPSFLQRATHYSARHAGLAPRHYSPHMSFSPEHDTGPIGYPESAQRSDMYSPGSLAYSPYSDDVKNEQANDDIPPEMPHNSHITSNINDTSSLSLIPQRLLPIEPNRYAYDEGTTDAPSSHQSHGQLYLSNTTSHFGQPIIPYFHGYGKQSQRQSDSPPSLFPPHLSLDNTSNSQGRYDSPSFSDITDAASYASLEAEGPHSLATPIHSQLHSSIPMRSDLGWSSASPPGAFDRTSPSIMADSDSPTSFGLPEPGNHRDSNDTTLSHSCPVDPIDSAMSSNKKKKSKMHKCEICKKTFPRPSGLKTHMNTHNNVKPFVCGFPGCSRTFTVRSNAKRHLRTHGVSTTMSRPIPQPAPYVVGFDTPTVLPAPSQAETHELSKIPYKLRWLPPSLSARSNACSLTSVSEDESDSEDGQDDMPSGSAPGEDRRSALSIPFCPVVPSSSGHEPNEIFEERNSYREAPLYPYHPSQFRALPGPAVPQQPISAV